MAKWGIKGVCKTFSPPPCPPLKDRRFATLNVFFDGESLPTIPLWRGAGGRRKLTFPKYLIAFFLLLFLSGNAILMAQTDAVASFDSGYVETGNPFRLHLSVPENYGQPGAVDFAPWDAFLPAKNIIGQSEWELKDGRWVKDYTLLTFDSAQLELPPLRLKFAEGEQVETNGLSLNVLPTPAPSDPSNMLDIKDIYREPRNLLDWLKLYWPIAAGVFVLALAVWLLLLRKQKTGLRAEREIRQPPHELALRKLAELQRKQHWQQGRIKTYYSELTHIAREYLERRYQIAALESPSDEIMSLLLKTELPVEFLEPLTELFQKADLAKFAKGEPPADYHERAFLKVQNLVEATKPREENIEAEGVS